MLLPNLTPGGAERVNVYLANALVEAGLEVDLVLLERVGPLEGLLDPRVRIVSLAAKGARRALGPLSRFLRSARPDAVLANMWPLTVVAWLAKLASRVQARLVFVEHTTWSISELRERRLTRWLNTVTMRLFYPRADAVVAVSDGSARDLERVAKLPTGYVQTIHNPVVREATDAGEATPTQPVQPVSWLVGDHKRLLAVGTLKPIKDLPSLLQAFARLRERCDVQLLILGEGQERAALEAQIRALGLQNQVHMPGFVMDTVPYFAHADLFVLSSRGEGLPSVIVEALEQGTPVVSTDCPSGPREILEDGRYGTLVPVGDVEALAQAMEEALNRPHDHEALKRRAQDFSVDKAANAYLELLLPGWREDMRGGA